MENQENPSKENNEFAVSTGNFVRNNRFFICGEIDETISENITAPLVELIDIRSKLRTPQPIEVFITSYGGYVKDGFDIISHFEHAKTLGVPIHTYVTSVACSCGSLIAVAGHQRFVSRRAYHLLHFARGGVYSHNPIMSERNLENDKWMQKELVNVYEQYTKLKNIPQLLLADNYMVNGGKDLIKWGLADKII